MADAQNTTAVLLNILGVLKRIERKLEKQEERFDQLKNPHATNNCNTSEDSSINEDNNPLETPAISSAEGKRLHLDEDHISSNQNDSNPEASRETRSLMRPAAQLIETPKIYYSHWSFGQEGREVDDGYKDILQKHFGEYWKIPHDNRLPLRTFKSGTHTAEGSWKPQALTHKVSISSFQERLALFSRFNTMLKSHKGNDFLVIDYDLANNTRLYRVGETAVGDELMVVPEGSENAPWSRLM